MIKKFREYLEEPETALMESVGIVDGKLVFDYNKLVASSTEISTKFGKTTGGKKNQIKFVPFQTTTDTLIKHKVYSVYSTKGVNKSTLLKTIKKQSNLAIANEDYNQFINRTAIFISAKIIKANKIDTIIISQSSSHILLDLIENIANRNPSITFMTKVFTKAKPDQIIINKTHSKITPEIINSLEKQVTKAKDNGYFQMKRIKVQFRKFIQNFIELTADKSLKKLENQNVLLMDDVISSGITLSAMAQLIELYSPNSVVMATIFK